MIPDFISIKGAPWPVLPAGIHTTSIDEVRLRFAYNERRNQLFNGLTNALYNLFQSGCRQVFLDGSYVTAKPFPNDFELCWDPVSVNPDVLDPVFLIFDELRAAQKEKYGGEFFPSIMTEGLSGKPFIDFFQTEKDTGAKKGIIRLLNDFK
jgi:hypothetical protein